MATSPIKYSVVVCLTAAITWSLSLVVHDCHGSSSSGFLLSTTSSDNLMGSFTVGRKIDGDHHNHGNHHHHKAHYLELMQNYSGPSRVWTKFEGEWCQKGEEKLMTMTPAHEGLLFQRPMKVGSTTMVGVVIRLAHTYSPWIDPNRWRRSPKCKHRSMHGSGLSMEYDKRDKSKSFLFSLVRDPTKRAISEFFHFAYSASLVDPTDRNIKSQLRKPGYSHKYLRDLSVTKYTTNMTNETLLDAFVETHSYVHNRTMLRQFLSGRGKPPASFRRDFQEHQQFGPNASMDVVVQDILDEYNFVAITERMDESLVAMQMLLNLTTKDILYTHSRSSGTFSNGPPPQRPCIFIAKSFVTPGMKEFFESEEWKDIIRGDMLLYKAARASLDRTIEALGKDEFQRKLRALKKGLALAKENCKGRIHTQCDEGGIPVPPKKNTCYIWGEGCDYQCINELNFTNLDVD